MIPRGYIDAWRSQAPWRSDAKVEQDLIIARSVVAVFSNPVLSRQLTFRGGTALHKLCFHPARRYSEDIDLVQIEAGPIGPVFDALRATLNPLLGEPQRKQGPGVVTLTYRMPSEMPPVVPLKLKVEINSREHFTVLGMQHVPFAMASPWFTGTCDVRCHLHRQARDALGVEPPHEAQEVGFLPSAQADRTPAEGGDARGAGDQTGRRQPLGLRAHRGRTCEVGACGVAVLRPGCA